MVIDFKVNLLIKRQMDTDNICMLMELNMLVIGKTMNSKDLEFKNGLMVQYIKEILLKEKDKGKEHINCHPALIIKDNGMLEK